MADIAVSVSLFLLERVLSTLDQEGHRGMNVHDEVKLFKNLLMALGAFVRAKERREGDEVLRERIKSTRDLAYDIEDVIDEYMLHTPHLFFKHKLRRKVHGYFHYVAHWRELNDMPKKIDDINTKIVKIKAMFDWVNDNSSEEASSSGGSSTEHHSTLHSVEVDEITGYGEYRETLVRQMMEGESRCISVVGPGGIGKTTLVRSVYNSIQVKGLFDLHAWVHVRSSLNLKELLCSILKQIVGLREKPSSSDVNDLVEWIRDRLQQKRYVIVFDDLRRTEDWEYIKKVLPSDASGSRIVVTTQNLDLASSCVESHRFIHTLNGLEWWDAWDLFCRKALPNSHGKCPPELEEWAQQILIRCEGLPFAIVDVGVLLSKKPPLPDEWKGVHDSLGSEIGTHATIVLLSSYKDLTSNLKNCFLYFSIFPEDYSIERGRLIRLWVAEGFVMRTTGKTVEQVAEGYLNELILRNLVHVSKWDFDGRVRSCRVLNHVLEFIVSKSEEENFVSILKDRNPISSERVRRLSIHSSCASLPQGSGFGGVRSTFLFRGAHISASGLENVLRCFRLLRVVDMQNAPIDEFPQDVARLTLLRYLSFRNTNITTVPNSIKKLVYLETLDLRQTLVTNLPKKIQRLHNLRHLFVYHYNVKNCVTFDSVQGVELPAAIGTLTSLQKLSLVKLDKHHNILTELAALTQLRKLGLIGLRREHGTKLCASVEKMEDLSTFDVTSVSEEEFIDLENMRHPPKYLRRLYLKGQLQNFPVWISSLTNLLRISLKWSKLRNSPLQALQVLPNLIELEVVDVFTGGDLVFEARGFQKLKKLHMERIDQLHTVVLEEGTMPELQKLILCKCGNLKMLPLGINYLKKLEELLVYDMHKEFVARLQKDSEDHEFVSHIPVIRSFTLGDNQSWSLQN